MSVLSTTSSNIVAVAVLETPDFIAHEVDAANLTCTALFPDRLFLHQIEKEANSQTGGFPSDPAPFLLLLAMLCVFFQHLTHTSLPEGWKTGERLWL